MCPNYYAVAAAFGLGFLVILFSATMKLPERYSENMVQLGAFVFGLALLVAAPSRKPVIMALSSAMPFVGWSLFWWLVAENKHNSHGLVWALAALSISAFAGWLMFGIRRLWTK